MDSKNLFRSTVYYYSKYRLNYPSEFLNLLLKELNLDKQDRLLDVGCGTGQASFPLHKQFSQIVAIDSNKAMMTEGEKNALKLDISNIQWLELLAEDISPDLGLFDLIIFGNSFHWMNPQIVLEKCEKIIDNEGAITIIGSNSFWNRTSIWEKKIIEIVQKWLGKDRKAGSGLFPEQTKSFEDYLTESCFSNITKGRMEIIHQWSIDQIIGMLYSTSYANKAILKDKVDLFEKDIRKNLLALNPKGEFASNIEYYYIIARNTNN